MGWIGKTMKIKRFMSLSVGIIIACVISSCGTGKTTEKKELTDSRETQESSKPSVQTETSVQSYKEELPSTTKLDEDYSVEIPVMVKSKVDTLFETSSGKKQLLQTFYKDSLINEQGYLSSYKRSGDNKQWISCELEYDSDGKIVKENEDNYNPKYDQIVEYEYNELGQCVKKTATKADSSKSVHEYFYNENGYITKEEFDDKRYEYEYDSAVEGRVVKWTYYYNGARHSEKEFQYDDAGHLIKDIEVSFGENGTDRMEEEMEYDPYGYINRVQIKQTYKDGTKENSECRIQYEVAGYKKIQAGDGNTLNRTTDWVMFDENTEIPKPDSVMPLLCTYVEKTTDGIYRYSLELDDEDPFGYNIFQMCFEKKNYADLTIQKKPNDTLRMYTAVLSEVLDYDVNQLDDGNYVVSKDGFPEAKLQYTFENGKYWLNVSLE